VALIEQIDRWALTALPAPRGRRDAAVHTETLGQVVDRLIQAWTLWHLLDTTDNPSDQKSSQAALDRVTELSIGYDDLVNDLLGGRRRLPCHQMPVGPAEA
ncbi:DUF4254 domain-containing protein, partial [Kibdelosporangium lantanae]